MANPNGQQGRAYMRQRIARWMEVGVAADGLAEKGGADEGDLWVVVPPPLDRGQGIIEEDKCTQRLSVDATLEKSIAKAGHERVLLAWKRMRGSKGDGRRSSYELVALSPAFAEVLVRCMKQVHTTSPDLVEEFWMEALS